MKKKLEYKKKWLLISIEKLPFKMILSKMSPNFFSNLIYWVGNSFHTTFNKNIYKKFFIKSCVETLFPPNI